MSKQSSLFIGGPWIAKFAQCDPPAQKMPAETFFALPRDENGELMMNIDTLIHPALDGNETTISGNPKVVLIVDDRPEFPAMIAPWLTSLGYRILTAADGKEAQGIMMEKGIANVDLLITDLEMPRMQGDELARWFVRENPNARVLVMSGCLGHTKLPVGVVCLEKPFSREAFIARIEELFGRAGVAAAKSTFGDSSL